MTEYTTFFLNDLPTTEFYTLSLHDALPICAFSPAPDVTIAGCYLSLARNGVDLAIPFFEQPFAFSRAAVFRKVIVDRKSTRLNSSHRCISYAVFCLKKKNIY